jgi:hypothetical protein
MDPHAPLWPGRGRVPSERMVEVDSEQGSGGCRGVRAAERAGPAPPPCRGETRTPVPQVAIAANEPCEGWTKTFTAPHPCAAIVNRLIFGSSIKPGTTPTDSPPAHTPRSGQLLAEVPVPHGTPGGHRLAVTWARAACRAAPCTPAALRPPAAARRSAGGCALGPAQAPMNGRGGSSGPGPSTVPLGPTTVPGAVT